jgi:hypothetical protein
VLGVYLGLVLFSLFVLIKPGASIFYYQKDLSPDQIAPDAGYAYRFPLRVDPTIYSPQGVLLEENGQKLLNDPPNLLVEQGQGRFFLTDPVEGGYYLYFSSSDNSDPRTNGSLYTLFFPVFFFSRPMGLLYLGILALPLGKFILFGLRSSPSLWAKLFSLARFTSTMDDFIRVEIFGSLYPLTNRLVTLTGRNRIWRQLLYWTVLAAFIYTGMEWLFFITKPSFMELYTLGEKITLLLQTGLFVGLPGLAFVALLWGVDTWLPLIKKIGLLLLVATLIPVALFSGLALLLVDNFTYTLIRFGVVSSAGLGRVAYAILFVIGYIKLYQLLLLTLGLRGAAT